MNGLRRIARGHSMRGYNKKFNKASTPSEIISDGLEVIIGTNAPFVGDVAGAAFNYGLMQAAEVFKKAAASQTPDFDTALQELHEIKFTNFTSTRQ